MNSSTPGSILAKTGVTLALLAAVALVGTGIYFGQWYAATAFVLGFALLICRVAVQYSPAYSDECDALREPARRMRTNENASENAVPLRKVTA